MKAEYNTRQRAIILDFLKENSAHVSARDIVAHLKEQGVVRKFIIDERSGACYQYAEGAECNEHFHLKCVSCGALIHVDCGFVAEMEKHFLCDHGFTVSSGRTVIYGVCSSCSKIDAPSGTNHHCCKGHEH